MRDALFLRARFIDLVAIFEVLPPNAILHLSFVLIAETYTETDKILEISHSVIMITCVRSGTPASFILFPIMEQTFPTIDLISVKLGSDHGLFCYPFMCSEVLELKSRKCLAFSIPEEKKTTPQFDW